MKTIYAAAVAISSISYAIELPNIKGDVLLQTKSETEFIWDIVDTVLDQTFQKTEEWNGHLYTFHNRRRSWNGAERICNDNGGHLVSIHSQQEQNFVQSLVDYFGIDRLEYHIGLNDQQREGQWVWSDMTEYDPNEFSAWKPGQPDDSGWFGEECAQSGVGTGPEGEYLQWADESCDFNYQMFICKRPVDHVPKWNFVDELKTWVDAQASCLAQGMHLASINNWEDNLAVQRLIDDNIDYNHNLVWIGYNDIEEEGKFVWAEDGLPGNFEWWWFGEPDNDWQTLHGTKDDGANCTGMSRWGNWSDTYCGDYRPFVCQRRDI